MLRNRNSLNVLLLLAVVICALSVVTSQHKARKLYIELQQEKEHAQQMDVEWGQLQLEQSTWATPARVEKIAAQQLQMHLPKSGEVQFIRVEPPSPQSSDGTTSHSARPSKGDSQVAGYPVNVRGGNSPLSLRENGSENFNGHIDKKP
ncbi:MAG: cell division protein FtsL [Nitrosomonadales bacterium]|nr:cell division protein FtsL [Nitrosomonadales bacterium]